MAREIMVDPEMLDAVAKRVESAANEYQTEYQRLYSVADDMGTKWQGADNVAFINQIAGFKDDFQKMHGKMLEYVDFLRKTANIYRETQDTIVAEAKKLQN